MRWRPWFSYSSRTRFETLISSRLPDLEIISILFRIGLRVLGWIDFFAILKDVHKLSIFFLSLSPPLPTCAYSSESRVLFVFLNIMARREPKEWTKIGIWNELIIENTETWLGACNSFLDKSSTEPLMIPETNSATYKSIETKIYREKVLSVDRELLIER